MMRHHTHMHMQDSLCQAYKGYGNSMLFQFWASVGGYFAMGLTWEQVNGDAAGTYSTVSRYIYID